MKEINLVWGESVAVRKEFIAGVRPTITDFRSELEGLNYSPFIGDDTLIEHTREVIKRQVGRSYRHILLTNGAAGGCTIAMRAFALRGRNRVWTHKPPYFSLYPQMIKAAGSRLTPRLMADNLDTIALIDSPSNPAGLVRGLPDGLNLTTIWDAVYGNNVYTTFNQVIPHHVLVGSYSKLTGLNGIRIGWIALDDSLLFETIKSLVSAEYCGLSVPSINVLNSILPGYDWETFENHARYSLDRNREQWSKLERFFGGLAVPTNGMFYYGQMDKTCQELMKKANIVWTPGSALGHSDDFGRFNIGQSNEIVKAAVEQILKTDSLR